MITTKKNYYIWFILLLISFFVLLTQFVTASTTEFQPNYPIVITSAGQSPDSFMVFVISGRYSIKVAHEPLLELEQLDEYQTIIFAMGGSVKGLGEAGIDEDDELKRIRSLLEQAEYKEISIIALHIGGEGRRSDLSMIFIEEVTPRSNYIIVTEEGNKDDYFSRIGKENNIPVAIIKEPMEVGIVLKEMFQQD